MWLPRLCTAMHTLRSCPWIHTQPSHQHCEGAVQYAVPVLPIFKHVGKRAMLGIPFSAQLTKLPLCRAAASLVRTWLYDLRKPEMLQLISGEKWFMWAHPGTLKEKNGLHAAMWGDHVPHFQWCQNGALGPHFYPKNPWAPHQSGGKRWSNSLLRTSIICAPAWQQAWLGNPATRISISLGKSLN